MVSLYRNEYCLTNCSGSSPPCFLNKPFTTPGFTPRPLQSTRATSSRGSPTGDWMRVKNPCWGKYHGDHGDRQWKDTTGSWQNASFHQGLELFLFADIVWIDTSWWPPQIDSIFSGLQITNSSKNEKWAKWEMTTSTKPVFCTHRKMVICVICIDASYVYRSSILYII